MTNDNVYREVLERFASHPLEGSAEKWKELMQLLALPMSCLEFVPLVLQEGAWRRAVDPARYVSAAVRRAHRKLERRTRAALPPSISQLNLPCDEGGTPMAHDEAIDYLNSRSLEDDGETPYVQLRVRRAFRGGARWDEEAEHTLNYSKLMDKVAVLAGLTKAQRDAIEVVLYSRGSLGLSREQILACPPPERRERQAAWKWIDRNKELIAKVLRSPQ